MIRDALDGFAIKAPIPIDRLGTIFWAESYLSGSEGTESGASNFDEFCEWLEKKEWTRHFATPANGSFGLVINLDKSFKEDGFDTVWISVDYLMSQIETQVSVDGEQSWGKEARFDMLAIPKKLVFCLKEFLLEFCGDELFCHYCCLPGEGDPRKIFIKFDNCQKLPATGDALLAFFAERLLKAIES